MTNPIRPTDNAARQLARNLLQHARHAALGVVLHDGSPMVTRIAFGLGPDDQALTLVSDLAGHTGALKANPNCSLLIGEPTDRGDPLTHPRLTLLAKARFLRKGDTGYNEMATHYLRDHPKSKLYIDFNDFSFALFDTHQAHLNGGFGKAFVLTPSDLIPPA